MNRRNKIALVVVLLIVGVVAVMVGGIFGTSMSLDENSDLSSSPIIINGVILKFNYPPDWRMKVVEDSLFIFSPTTDEIRKRTKGESAHMPPDIGIGVSINSKNETLIDFAGSYFVNYSNQVEQKIAKYPAVVFDDYGQEGLPHNPIQQAFILIDSGRKVLEISLNDHITDKNSRAVFDEILRSLEITLQPWF